MRTPLALFALLLAASLPAQTTTSQVSIPLAPGVTLDLARATVTRQGPDTRATGELGLTTPLGPITMARSDIVLRQLADGRLDTFAGRSVVPAPSLGPFQGLRVEDPTQVEVLYQRGADLRRLDAPLQDGRKYLAYRISQGLALSVGDFTLKAPGHKEALLVLDPADPFLFVTGDLPGLKKLGKLEDLGIGLSAQGLIPFEATTRWALDRRARGFQGHLYLRGKVPLGKYPMAIQGETAVRLQRVGPSLVPTAVGGNGTLLLVVPLLDFIDFEMQLGTASAVASYEGRNSQAYFSGVARPTLPFLPKDLPVLPEREMKVAGLIDAARIQDSFLRAEGKYEMGLARLTKLVGIELKDLRETKGFLRLDRDGFVAKGVTRSQFSPLVKFDSQVEVHAFFSRQRPTKDFSVGLTGALKVGGVGLGADAKVELGPRKAEIRGRLKTPIQSIALSGNLGRGGVNLSGEAELRAPIRGATKVVETVTNGAICGYHVVKDGAKCGFDTVTSGAICGTKVVADGAKCGFTTVTDGAVCGFTVTASASKCGYEWVKSGSVCGWSKVTDGAKCGWEWTKCLINPLKWGKCKKAKSCKVAKKCKKAKKCKIAKTCKKPRKCQVENTCKVAKSCKDLSKPRTCKREVKIPDAHLGDLIASVKVTVTHRGASGDVSGRYCLKDGKCLTLAGGKVKFDPKPQACVNLPGLGERCIGF